MQPNFSHTPLPHGHVHTVIMPYVTYACNAKHNISGDSAATCCGKMIERLSTAPWVHACHGKICSTGQFSAKFFVVGRHLQGRQQPYASSSSAAGDACSHKGPMDTCRRLLFTSGSLMTSRDVCHHSICLVQAHKRGRLE